jgi:hypothetical protein
MICKVFWLYKLARKQNILQMCGATNRMNLNQKPPLPKRVFKVVARRQRTTAEDNDRPQEQPQVAQFSWKNFEQMGKIAGVVISLLSLCGILFAAGSKIQHLIDDLANLHKQVDKHEERLLQNEANDSRRAEEVGYLKGKLEQHSDREADRRAGHIDIETREAPAPTRTPSRSSRSPSSPPPPPPTESRAIPIGDKLYMTILYYYNQALRRKPNLAGQLTVICKVDQAGYLAATEVTASSPELAEIAARLAATIRHWKFPQHVTGLESGSFRKSYFLSPEGF